MIITIHLHLANHINYRIGWIDAEVLATGHHYQQKLLFNMVFTIIMPCLRRVALSFSSGYWMI